MGCDAAHDRQEQTKETQRERSARSPASADLVKTIDAMNDTTLVHEWSGTHPHECEEKFTPKTIKNVIPDRMQNKSPDHPVGITDEDGKVYRRYDHLGNQEAAVIGEGGQ